MNKNEKYWKNTTTTQYFIDKEKKTAKHSTFFFGAWAIMKNGFSKREKKWQMIGRSSIQSYPSNEELTDDTVMHQLGTRYSISKTCMNKGTYKQ